MDAAPPYLGDGLVGPVPFWTPDIKEVTAAFEAPLVVQRRGPRGRLRLRRALTRLAVVAVLAAPGTTLLTGSPVVAAGASSPATANAHPGDTWA